MNQYEAGMFAISKAGHDKNRIYVIIREDDEYAYLADGVFKIMVSPKRKNKKHIQLIHAGMKEQFEDSKTVTDEQIKRAIKQYTLDRK